MFSSTTNRQSRYLEELATETAKQRPYRPHGHVVGHALGDPPPRSFAGRPRGHVVGHALGGGNPTAR